MMPDLIRSTSGDDFRDYVTQSLEVINRTRRLQGAARGGERSLNGFYIITGFGTEAY